MVNTILFHLFILFCIDTGRVEIDFGKLNLDKILMLRDVSFSFEHVLAILRSSIVEKPYSWRAGRCRCSVAKFK